MSIYRHVLCSALLICTGITSLSWADQTLQLDTSNTYCNHTVGSTTVYARWTNSTCIGNYAYTDTFTVQTDAPVCTVALTDHNQPAIGWNRICRPLCCCWTTTFPDWQITVSSTNCFDRTSGDFTSVHECDY